MAKWRQELRWMRHAIARCDHEMRLDRWLRQQFPLAPQSLLQAQLRKRKIRLVAPIAAPSSGKQVAPDSYQAPAVPGKANSVLLEGFTVAIDAHLFRSTLQHPSAATQLQRDTPKPKPLTTLPLLRDLLQRIVYRDANYLVLDKPHGLAVQDGTGLESSLADYLPAIAKSLKLSDTTAADTPRLVHRLDKETSGLLVLARHRLAAAKFTELLQSNRVHKTYHALVAVPPTRKPAFEARLALFRGEIASPVDGKPATTLVKPLATIGTTKTREDPRGVWLELSPVTGRKHQLRVHCAQVLHAPIVGDSKYRGPKADRLHLHAQRIEFPDPFGSEKVHTHQRRRQQQQGSLSAMIDIRRSVDHVYASTRDTK